MIAAWFGYAVLLTVLAGIAALALEHAAAIHQRARRWTWAAAMVVSVVVPATLGTGLAPASFGTRAASAGLTIAADGGASAPAPATTIETLLISLSRIDPWLLVVWGAFSASLALVCVVSALALVRARRRWSVSDVDGVRVFVSDDTGPAVSLFGAPRIVMPRWALSLAPDERSLLLQHELEHLRTHDASLVAVSSVALILAPWNPALWWLWRRLRAAVELDCDARVLGRHGDTQNYGTLLLAVAERRTLRSATSLPVLAFAETRTHLERRILAMTQKRPSRPVLRALAALGIAGTITAIACEAPRPSEPVAPLAEYSWSAGGARETKKNAADSVELRRIRAFVKQVVGERHPEIARGEGGDQPVMIVVDDEGALVESTRLARAAFPLRMKQIARGEKGDQPVSVSERAEQEFAARIVPEEISTIEVLKLQPGEVAPRRVGAIVVRLKPGATLRPLRSPR